MKERKKYRGINEVGHQIWNIQYLKLSFQLNPPQVMSEAVMYSKLSSEITSITGHTTAFL